LKEGKGDGERWMGREGKEKDEGELEEVTERFVPVELRSS
jgi:hypothetical protein